jgi:hypothetical protein
MSDLTKEGVKYDAGKARWSLLPFDAVEAIVWILNYGAKKYTDRNWELGMDWDRVFDACQRHMTDWWQRRDKGKGPGKDADTGYSDLWHAGCCILFLIAYEMRGVGKDTRPSV